MDSAFNVSSASDFQNSASEHQLTEKTGWDLQACLKHLRAWLQADALQPQHLAEHPLLSRYAPFFQATRVLTQQVELLLEQQQQQTQLLEVALREASVAVWNWDLQTQEGGWSQALLQIFEIPQGAPLPETLHARLLPQDHHLLQEALRAVLRGESFPKLIMPLQLPSGTRRIIALTGVVLEGPSGRQLAGQVQDLTELTDLYEERNHLVSLEDQLDAMGIFVMRYDPATQTYHITPHLLQSGLLGSQPVLTQGQLGHFFQHSVHPEDQGMLLRYEEELQQHGEGYEVRFRCWRHQHWTWMELLAQAFAPAGGKGHHLYLFREVDEEMALQAEFDRQERETALWLIGQQFLHELSTPVTAISMALDVLWTKRPDAQGMESPLQRARAARDQINTLLRNLRKLMRATHLDELYEINASEMAARASSFLGGLGRHCGAVVELEIEPELPLFRGRELSVLQALLCLIENGCEAQQQIGVSTPLKVRFRRGDGELLLEVEDAGPGISKDLQPLVLYRGFTTKEEGTGYGLSMLQHIVEQHQGSLEILTQTPEHPGTLFRIHLPRWIPGATPTTDPP